MLLRSGSTTTCTRMFFLKQKLQQLQRKQDVGVLTVRFLVYRAPKFPVDCTKPKRSECLDRTELFVPVLV